MIFNGWKFPNEAVDKNDFETSELYKKMPQKLILRNDFQIPSTPSKYFPKVGVIYGKRIKHPLASVGRTKQIESTKYRK